MSSSRKDDRGRVLKTGESQRSNGTYMYRYTDIFGKRRTLYANTLNELRQRERELIVKNELGLQISPSTATLKILIEKQMPLMKANRISTQEQHARNVKLLYKYPIATIPISKITQSNAKEWLLQMSEEGYATNTIKSIIGLAKTACRIALADKEIYYSPFEFKLDFLPPKNKRQALSSEQQESLLRFLGSKKKYSTQYNQVTALIETGMRIGEFVGLTEKDIDFKQKVVYVRRQIQGWNKKDFRVSVPKSEAGIRSIPLSDRACSAFQNIIQHYKDKGVEMEPIDGMSNFIVRGRNGSFIPPRAFPHYFETICNAYNKCHDDTMYVTPHMLRHSFCTNLAHSGVSLPTIQYLMGHATPETTLNIYTHTEKDRAHSEFRKAFSA